jgi:hypothetical protein
MSPRPSRDGMHKASAECKQARLRRARRGSTGQAGNLAETGDSQGASRNCRKPGSAKGTVSARQLRMAANTRAFGQGAIAAGQERKPDAGASAGDKSLARPAARQGSKRLDIGRQARPETSEADGPPEVSRGTGRPHAGESGVGSNAGPICIAPFVWPRFYCPFCIESRRHVSPPEPSRALVKPPRPVRRTQTLHRNFSAIHARIDS